ncbi:MAG: hypothetical protein WBM80_07165 [Woeseiaceae bacterium]
MASQPTIPIPALGRRPREIRLMVAVATLVVAAVAVAVVAVENLLLDHQYHKIRLIHRMDLRAR